MVARVCEVQNNRDPSPKPRAPSLPYFHMQPLHRPAEGTADLTNLMLHAAVDDGAAQDHLVDGKPVHRALELLERTADGHAIDPLMGLERIVVDEPDGIEVPGRVGAHLADDELAERAGAVDEHAATPFAPRRGDEVHRPERGA